MIIFGLLSKCFRSAKAEQNRLEKKARVEVARAEKREAAEHRRSLKRMSDIDDLFGDDFVERRKRETNTTDYEDYDIRDLDWDYYEYYYGEGDDYEVEVGGKVFG